MTAQEFTNRYALLEHKLYAFAMTLTRNTSDADDLLQETIVRAFTYRTSFQLNTNFKAWITTIMRNTFSNKCRTQKRRRRYNESVEGYENLAVSIANAVFNSSESNIMVNELITMIEELDAKYRIPFLMSYQGFEYQEIANKMNVPVGTVKSRLFTARQQLKSLVQTRYPQEVLRKT